MNLSAPASTFSPDPIQRTSGTFQVYIGESDIVRKRLVQHNKDESKDFWERICVVTSKDQNITKAHARYLEARLIAIANASGNASVVNETAPTPLKLPEADECDMECFIEQLKLIFPVLGFDFLRQYEPVAQTDLDNRQHPQQAVATLPTSGCPAKGMESRHGRARSEGSSWC